MWVEYMVKPFEGNNTGKYRSKQLALENAQKRAIKNPNKTFTVYRAKHYTNSEPKFAGMCDLIPLITYWFDKKLQYQKEI
jgi:hypothetical protein